MHCVCLQGSASCISKEDTLQTQRRFWKGFQQYNVVNFVVSSYIVIVVALVLPLADVTPSVKAEGAHSRRVVPSPCVHPISLESGPSSKLSTLAADVQHTATRLDVAPMKRMQSIRQPDADLSLLPTSQRCISTQSGQNADMAYKMSIAANAALVSAIPSGSAVLARQAMPAIHFVSQKFARLLSVSHGSLKETTRSMPLSASMLQGDAGNVFAYGQCTWWANQRYHQLHNLFVPWRTNADAYQWVARAMDFGWHVSSTPTVGSIMVLQPYVDGAYELGHVGVVEQILTNGRVIASSTNWGGHPDMVTQATYVLGPGVSFISSY